MPASHLDRENLVADGLMAMFGYSVTYTQGATSASLTVVNDKSGVFEDDGSGVIDRVEYPAFVFRVADFTTAGLTEPQAGDTITETVNGVPFVRKVGADPNEDIVSYDAGRVLMRVRTWDRQ